MAKRSGEELVKASREKGRPPIAVVKTIEYVATQEYWRIRRAIIQCVNLLVPGTPFMMSETPGKARCPQLPELAARA